MRKNAFVLILMLLGTGTNASAEVSLDINQFYVGAGIGFNDLPGVGSANGFQFLGGYAFKQKLNDDITTAIEIGFMDTGDFEQYDGFNTKVDAQGVWVALAESVPLSRKTDMLFRLGFDFGDDDGVLLGTGLQYKFDTKLAFRMEYVARQNVDSLQANVLVKF